MNYLMKAEGAAFYRILIAPVSRTSIITAQILEAVCCTFLEVGILFGAGLFFFSENCFWFCRHAADCTDCIPDSFFHVRSDLCNQPAPAQRGHLRNCHECSRAASLFLSTALFPADTLTGPLKTIVNFNPLTHVINILRTLLLQGEVHLHNLLWVICLLVVLCAISFCAALRGLKKEMSL